MNLNSLLKSIRSLAISKTFVYSSICTYQLCFGIASAELNPSELPGWQQDDLTHVWSTWQQSCIAFEKQDMVAWHRVCSKSNSINPDDTKAVRDFFEQNFTFTPISNDDGSRSGIITGYYEPVLTGSLHPDEQYQYPIYAKPQSETARTLSRQQIEENPEALSTAIIAWTDNPYDLFFLHIQGSGLIKFKDGTQKSLGYAGNNDHDYTAIGKVLIENGEMQKQNVSMQSLKQWLHEHPHKARDVMNKNQRFIYFNMTDNSLNESGPRGSLNVPLTPLRSIAIDPKQVTLGSPIWLDTTLPQIDQIEVFKRLVFAQDTGAAIKGRIRADVFFGRGKQAEFLSGNMNQSGQMYLLKPK